MSEAPKDSTKCADSLINAIIIGVIILCLVGIIICMASFVFQSLSFGKEYTNALSAIASLTKNTSADTALIESLVTHMEAMEAIQKDGLRNDLMSFVYGALSTILVALCAKFVEKCSNNATAAKESTKTAQEKAKAAESAAEKAEEKAKRADDAAEEARRKAEAAELSATKSGVIFDKVDTIDKKVTAQSRKAQETQSEIIAYAHLQKTYICIMNAKMALLNLMNEKALNLMTERSSEEEDTSPTPQSPVATAFSNLLSSAKSLNSHVSILNPGTLEPLINELCFLQTQIQQFENYLTIMSVDPAIKSTLKEAAVTYQHFTEVAISLVKKT